MFERLRELLHGPEPDPNLALDQSMVAAAAVMVEAARMDDHFDLVERQAIRRILGERFGLTPEETEVLLVGAEEANRATHQLFPFIQALVTRLTPEQRIPIIEMLWEVVYADGLLTPEEDALIRRIAGLLYVSDRDRGLARQKVLRRLGQSG